MTRGVVNLGQMLFTVKVKSGDEERPVYLPNYFCLFTDCFVMICWESVQNRHGGTPDALPSDWSEWPSDPGDPRANKQVNLLQQSR